ncbi:MAG: DUF2066 domain-containing protein [Gammaproteobacteria bacterium]|nr:DUF2066 domain-containing protein [Gammaproteobacteria bacterium]
MSRLILILISMLVTNNVVATTLTSLYQSQLPVSSQSAEERAQLAPKALKRVLLKVVGDSQRLNSTDLTTLLDQADQFIEQYQYHRMNTISDDLTQPDILELQFTFNEQELNQAIKQIGLPIWGKSRPEILLWVVVDNVGERMIINEDSHIISIANALKHTFKERGVFVIMPLMDLHDQLNINAADLWAGFSEPIINASQRYDAQVIVVARVSLNSQGMMHIKWQSINTDKQEQWLSSGANALTTGLAELADRTARSYTQDTDDHNAQRYVLQISNVKGYGDYIRIKKYLSNLITISNVELAQLTSNSVEINIVLSSNISTLNRTLAIDRVLEEEKYQPQSNNIMYYKLVL